MTTDSSWNRPIARWRQAGRVFLWRYPGAPFDYRGWHLTADEPGGVSLSELLSLLENAAPYDGRTVRLSPPTADVLSVPNYQHGAAAWTAPAAWALSRSSSSTTESVWEREEHRLSLTLTHDGLT
ncbi:MAG: hypothetical protein AAF907_15185 [Planctomycetota bacterium]